MKTTITESQLNKLIFESVKKILKEDNLTYVSSKPHNYTLAELLRDQNYNGDINTIAQYLANAATAENFKLNPNETKMSNENWIKLFNVAAQKEGGQIGKLLSGMGQKVAQTVNATVSPENAKMDFDNAEAGAYRNHTTGVEGTPGDTLGMKNKNGSISADRLITMIQGQFKGSGKSHTFTSLFEPAGILRGYDRTAVESALRARIKQASTTVIQTYKDAGKNAIGALNAWISGQNVYNNRLINDGEIANALSYIGKTLGTSRNEMPATMGFQKMLNLFGIKDSKGRPFAIDGVIGQETSKALANAGFKDIYELKQAVQDFQANNNVPPQPDGVAGKNTIAALKQLGINSFEALKLNNERHSFQSGNNRVAQINRPEGMNVNLQAPTQNQGIGSPTLSERKISEIVGKVLKEQTSKKNLNENYQINFKALGNPMNPEVKTFSYDRKNMMALLQNFGYTPQQIQNGVANRAISVVNGTHTGSGNIDRQGRRLARTAYANNVDTYQSQPGAKNYHLTDFIKAAGLNINAENIYARNSQLRNAYCDFNRWKQWFTLRGKDYFNGKEYREIVNKLNQTTEPTA